MLTRPLTLTETDDRGRGLVAVTPPPALPLADGGDDVTETQTGVFSPPAHPWSSCSTLSISPSCPPSCTFSPPPPPPLSTSSPPSLSPFISFLSSPLSFVPPSSLSPSASSSSSSLNPPPPPSSPPSYAHSLLSSAPSTCPPPPSVFFTAITPPTSSSFSVSSSSPPSPLSVCLPPLSSSVSPFPFISHPPSVAPSLSHPAPPLPSSSCSAPSLSSVPASPAAPTSPSLSVSPPSPSSPSVPLTLHPSPLSSPLKSVHSPPPVSFSPLSPPSPHNSTPFPPAPLPPLHYSQSSVISPPPRPPCCPCSSLLPRLLSAHRLEVRRLLRGALASLGRRLDSLERRSRRRRRQKMSRQRGEEEGEAAFSPGSAACPFSSTSTCSSAHLPPVTTPSSPSSSDSEDLTTPPLSSSLSQSEHRRRRRRRSSRGEEEGRGRKRRRNNQRGGEGRVFPENREEEEEEEEDAGRFVGRMVVSVRGGGAKEELPLTLHNFNHRKRREKGRASQSEKAVSVVRQNGYRELHSISSSSSQHALQLLQSLQSGQVSSQSDALSVSSGQWRFSDFTQPHSISSSHSALNLWLSSSSFSSSSFNSAPLLHLSAVAVEMLSESMRGGACVSPLRSLKDWTAPPSLSIDHCYVRTPSPSPIFPARRLQKQRANHSSRSIHLPRRRASPLPPCSANALSAPLPISQSSGCKFLSTNGERGKCVSQIRIRRASPRETPLTPMGLPKVKRLKKKEFSLEEIYTNKNYKSPTTNRSLETIFEEPREKDGPPFVIGQQKRRRLLLFPDFTQPRKRKRPQGAGLPVATVARKRAAARRHCHGGGTADDESDLDVMLVERLSALEDFLTRQGLDV